MSLYFQDDLINITNSIDLKGTARWDDVSVQAFISADGNNTGIGIYEESQRGAFGEETVNHMGYPISHSDYQKLQTMIEEAKKNDDLSKDVLQVLYETNFKESDLIIHWDAGEPIRFKKD